MAALLALPSSSLATLRLSPLSLAPASSVEVPDRSLSDAARDAEEQAGVFYARGSYQEALSAQQRSVQLHRKLVGKDPSQRPQLAASLHNLAVVLIRLNRKTEAIAPTKESLDIYRAVATAKPGQMPMAIERPLRNLVLLYFEANQPQEALPLADELVQLHRSWMADDAAARAEQVDVFNLRASLLVALNRPREALRDLGAAVALGKELMRQSPTNLGLQYGLAGSLVNLSQVADLLGQPAQALQPAQEAEALLRQVARAQPQFLGDWAKSLSRLGQAYARLGDPARAQQPLEESIALLRLLSRSGPSGTLAVEVGGYRDDLAHALESLAGVQQQLDHAQEAKAAAVEAMEMYQSLVPIDPRYARDVERMRSWSRSMPQATPARR